MPAQTLGIILFIVLGFCIFLALGAYLGKILTPGKLVTFTGVIALIAVLFYAVYAAYYIISLPK